MYEKRGRHRELKRYLSEGTALKVRFFRGRFAGNQVLPYDIECYLCAGRLGERFSATFPGWEHTEFLWRYVLLRWPELKSGILGDGTTPSTKAMTGPGVIHQKVSPHCIGSMATMKPTAHDMYPAQLMPFRGPAHLRPLSR